MAVTSKSKIEFIIGLDENKIPEELNWSADDGNIKENEKKEHVLYDLKYVLDKASADIRL